LPARRRRDIDGSALMTLQLSLAYSSNPRTRPILDGTIRPEGIDLIPSVIHPSEMFWRQLRFRDFDVSEMSISHLMTITAAGNTDWIGIPVFTTRKFFHTEILVRRDAGIAEPADLRGKRTGVPEYQQTAALWTRGVLQNEFGVDQTELEHWMERVPTHSHAGALDFKPPEGVTIRQIPAEKSIGSMMISGELQAVIHYIRETNLVDRSTADLHMHPDIRTLFPDPVAEGVRFYRKTGIYPINHAMVIRREIAEKHPWTVLSLLNAFNQANEIANRQRIAHVQEHAWAGSIAQQEGKALGESVVRHGIKANRKTLETVALYSHQQGLTHRLVKVEELFAPISIDQ
jgi:4,5-dihydroxyphthalate decarboxylase